mmetsp:Transcript_1080/g.1990  ORF Transcript_1080/g.1990 Transcript_1080/m.1990 type:complete len:174 (+) Transcript_1080:1216-1737(+)
MKPRDFTKGKDIITYGDFGEEYFVMSQGTVRVFVYKAGADPKDPKLDEQIQFQKLMEQGTGFGELALMYNSKRTATIRAESDFVQTFVLDGKIFKTILIKSSLDKRQIQNQFLDNIEMFNSLSKQQKQRLTEGLKTIYLKKDEFVFREGQEGEDFYIIEAGTVDCLKLHEVFD